MDPEPLYTPDTLLDEEVNEALMRNDPNLIWAMTATLATMDTEEWARHRAAIRKRFNGTLNIGLLDKAIREKQEHTTTAQSHFSPKNRAPWEELLHVNEKGDPKAVLINADIALRNHPSWSGVLVFDEFKQKIRVVKQPPIGGVVPRDWSDTDDTNAAVWMQSNGIYIGRDVVASAVHSVAMENQIHVVRDYLNSLQWDGVPIIDRWLSAYMGAEDSPLSRMVGSRWLISAIARVMQPGCQCDYMMVLEGLQGTKKSTALKALASQEWFCDHTPDLHDKDSQMQLSGSWIVEWGELDAIRKSEVTSVKNFLSRKVEKFRPPYGRYVVEIPRQCVFAGTTNEVAWLKDDTGNRRFWPIPCGAIQLEALERHRDQLWAEALVRYIDGAIWWPETSEEHKLLAVEQNARMEIDPWQETVLTYLSGTSTLPEKTEVTMPELLTDCMKISILGQSQAEKNRVGRVMKLLGWRYVRERVQGSKDFFNGYKPPLD